MSTDLVTVPTEARDANLTPTQRFEMIARTGQGMAAYQAPRETGEVTTRAGTTVPRAVTEHAQFLSKCRDKNGLVTSEQYVAGGGCDSATSLAFTYGYQLPAKTKFDPVELQNILFIAKQAKIPQQYAWAFLVEFAKYLT